MDNDTMHARIGLRMHEFNLRVYARSCVHRSLPRKPRKTQKQIRTLKQQTSNLRIKKGKELKV